MVCYLKNFSSTAFDEFLACAETDGGGDGPIIGTVDLVYPDGDLAVTHDVAKTYDSELNRTGPQLNNCVEDVRFSLPSGKSWIPGEIVWEQYDFGGAGTGWATVPLTVPEGSNVVTAHIGPFPIMADQQSSVQSRITIHNHIGETVVFDAAVTDSRARVLAADGFSITVS